MEQEKHKKIYDWKDVKHIINITIYNSFADKAGELEKDKHSAFYTAERNISKRLMYYVPCLELCKDELINIWVAFFDFMFISKANEKNENAYSQITTNYRQAIEWIEAHKDEICKKYAPKESITNVNDYVKIHKNKSQKLL